MTLSLRRPLLFLVLLALTLGSCTGPLGGTPSPQVTATPSEVQPTPTPSPTPAPPTVFRLWLPPEFDPNADTPGAVLLRQQLEAFAKAEGVALDVRLKAVDGPGGMLPTLADAEVVAPDAVPEALLLPRWALETAALKGLLSPLSVIPQEGLPDVSSDYPFAIGLSQVQGVPYGLTVGGQAFVMLYPADAFAEGFPPTWAALVASANLPWRWAAGDPQARLVMGVYHALGGPLRSAEGRPTLEATALTKTLSDFAQLAQQGLLIPSLLDLTTDQATWEYYGQTPSALLFLPQRYALQSETAWQIAPIPGAAEGAGWAWADGYLWAIPQQSGPRQALAARWLVRMADPTFLGPWTEALGLLPPSPNVLAQWKPGHHTAALEAVAQQATPLPSMDILTTLGPVLQQALAQVIQGATPEEAAQQALQSLPGP